MKKGFKSLVGYSAILLLAVASIVQLSSCNGSGDPTAQEIITAKLVGTWKIKDVLVDGIDQSSVFKDFTLTFESGKFTAANGRAVWPTSGTWTFSSDNGTKLKRDDGTEVIIDVTDTSLKLTLNWAITALGSGRINSVKGKNVFTFSR